MFIVDSVVEPSNNDPMLIDSHLQDSDCDLENMNSMRHQQDFGPHMDEFEQLQERWQEDPEFNLFDYIGDEEADQQGSSLTDGVDPKDQIYKQWAYNQTAFGAPADPTVFQNTYNNMGRAIQSTNTNQAAVPNAYEQNGYFDYGSTSSASMVSTGSTPPKMNNATASFLPVKREPAYDYDEMSSYLDDEYSRPSAAVSAALSIDPSVVEQAVNQVTKKPPRKYRMKPDQEKVNPVYKHKRAKNNDAVRRSREKAKVIQQQKEGRLMMLENDVRILWDYHLKTLEYMKQNCSCGIAVPKPPKLQTMER